MSRPESSFIFTRRRPSEGEPSGLANTEVGGGDESSSSGRDNDDMLILLGDRIKWEFCLNPIDDNNINNAQPVLSTDNNANVDRFVQDLFRIVKYVHDLCHNLSGRLSALEKDSKHQRGTYLMLLRALYIIYELDVISMKKSDALIKTIQSYKTRKKHQQQLHAWTSSAPLLPTPAKRDPSQKPRSKIDIGATRSTGGVSPATDAGAKWTAVKTPIHIGSGQTSPMLMSSGSAQQSQTKPRRPLMGHHPSDSMGSSPIPDATATTPSTPPTLPRFLSQSAHPHKPGSQLPYLSLQQTQARQQTSQPPNFPVQTSPHSPSTSPKSQQTISPPQEPMSPPLQLSPSQKSPQNRTQESENENKGMAELDNLIDWFSARYPGMCYARSLFPEDSHVLNGFIQFCLNILGDKVMSFSEGFKSHLTYIRGLTFGFFFLFTAECAQERDELGIPYDQSTQEATHMLPDGIAMSLWSRAEPWISSIPFTPICEGRYNEYTTALFDTIPALSNLVTNINAFVTRFKSDVRTLFAEAILPGPLDFTTFFNTIPYITQDIYDSKKATEKFNEAMLFLVKMVNLTTLLKTTLIVYSTTVSTDKKKKSNKSITCGKVDDYVTNYDKQEDLRWEKLFPPVVIDFALRVLRDISMFNRMFERKEVYSMLEELSLTCRKKLDLDTRLLSVTSDAFKYTLINAGIYNPELTTKDSLPSDTKLSRIATMLVDHVAVTPSAKGMKGFDQASLDNFMGLYGLTRIRTIIENTTDLSILWFVRETQHIIARKGHGKRTAGKSGIFPDRLRDTALVGALSSTQLLSRKPPPKDPQLALQGNASTSSLSSTTVGSPLITTPSASSSSSSLSSFNVVATQAQEDLRGVQLGQEIVKYLSDIKDPWCALPDVEFTIPADDNNDANANNNNNGGNSETQTDILSDRDYYEKEDLDRIRKSVKMKKGISFASFLTVRLMNMIMSDGKGNIAKLSNIDAIYRRIQRYYTTYRNSAQNTAAEDNVERKQRLFRCLCRRLIDAAHELFIPFFDKQKQDGGGDPTASIEFFLSCTPSMPVWFPKTYEDVFIEIDIVMFIFFMTRLFERRFRRMICGIDDALSRPAPVSEEDFWGYMDTYMLELLSMTLVLDFVGSTAKRPAGFESPFTIFSHNAKYRAAKRVFMAMLSNRLHAERVALSDRVSQGLVSYIKVVVTEDPELVYARDTRQNSLLHWASWLLLEGTSNEELFKFLVGRGCSLEGRNCAGETPFLACKSAKNAIALARMGACINAAREDGSGFADLHPDWVPMLLEALKVDALPQKEELIVIDIAVSSETEGEYTLSAEQEKDGQESTYTCVPNVSLATRFVITAANRMSHQRLLKGKTAYSWLYSECDTLAATATAAAAAAQTWRKKKREETTRVLRAEKKLPKECWPLVPLLNVMEVVTGKTVLARLGIFDRMDEKTLRSCAVLLELYDVSKADSLDASKIQADIAQSQAVSRYIIGVGSETRSDRASIIKYWEQHVLPVRLEDAARTGRQFSMRGIGECVNNGEDIYTMLCAAADAHLQRLYRIKEDADNTKVGEEEVAANNAKREGLSNDGTARKNRARITRLIPMQPSDSCYDTVKMLVLGHEEAGKTSLLDSISEKHSWKTFSKAIWKKRSAQTKSTIGISRVQLTIGEVPVNAYDFGGQLEYHAIHEYFLSPYCAMYVVVVDGSKERLTEQLGYWLQLLHSHSKGPRGSCALIVVCTKADVIEKRFCADAVVAKKGFLKNYLSSWPSLRKIASTEVFMVSNKTGVGIKALHDALKERARALSKTLVSQVNLRAAKAFANVSSTFMSFAEFTQFMVDNKVITKGNLPPEYTRQITRDILDFLHNSGEAVVSSGYDTICCRPELMSNVLSTFVAPEDHKQRLMGKSDHKRSDIFTRSELVWRFQCFKEVNSAHNPEKLCTKIISSLEDMKFCYALRPEEAILAYNLGTVTEECYIFPSLCDTVDLVALPYNEAADRGPEIIRIKCHGYECAGCRSRFSAPRWEPVPAPGVFCPKCGCPKIVHVCLNEAPGAVSAFIGARHQEVCTEYLAVIQEASSNSMWTCLMNDVKTGAVQKVGIPRPCPCVELVAPAVKYVACIVNSMVEQGISMSQFNRVSVQLRRYMHPRYRLFRNFVVFRDIYGNVILATIFVKDGQRALGIISRGTMPHLWVESLNPLLSLGEAVVPACPACAHVNTFAPLKRDSPGGGQNQCVMVCENGHAVTTDQMYMGMSRNERLCAENTLWAPKKAAAFYEESAGKWLTDGRYPNAIFTELTAGDSTPARQAEYIFARSLFYKFVGTDPASSKFSLTKVVFIENKTVEALFASKFSEFAARAYSSNPSWRSAGPTKEENTDEEKLLWQQRVMEHLRKYLERVCGNEQINLVGGWHGTIDKSAHGIANTNFYMPAENKASKDPGYFGRGVYFTQSPAYGVDYAVFSANITKQHAQDGGTFYEEEELRPCLVFSWILLGRVYPVTEAADVGGGKDSLMGKGCVPGYDSHYVVLPQQPRGAKHAPLTRPYNFNSLLDKPGCDEIVVFNKAQILPRYIFYYNNVSDAKDRFLPLEVRDAKTVVLWVDDEINSSKMDALHAQVKQTVPEAAIVTMVSSGELKLWLHQFGQEVEDKIVVITNFFRANDGETNAAWRVVNEVRKVAKLKKVPILVHSKNPSEDVQNFSKMKLVYTTSDDTGVIYFISEKKIYIPTRPMF